MAEQQQQTSAAMASGMTVKTGSGAVTVTAEAVTIRRPGGMQTDVMRRSAITGIETKTAAFSLFGMGGAKRIILRGAGGEKLTIVASNKAAKALLAVLP